MKKRKMWMSALRGHKFLDEKVSTSKWSAVRCRMLICFQIMELEKLVAAERKAAAEEKSKEEEEKREDVENKAVAEMEFVNDAGAAERVVEKDLEK